ncbi:MAG: tetratricopeptide repeat protein [Duncaniella sp.]|nr:tetratricopeptide repeat protein [Duncaniella sp.]
MKKLSVLAFGLLAAGSLSAQTALVKDAEKAFKAADSYPAFSEAVTVITPAFTNPETAKDSRVYAVPAENAFRIYDAMYARKTLGQQVDEVQMGQLLNDGYKYTFLTLDTDTIVDAKGKVKTPNSKKVSEKLAGHFNDYVDAFNAFWGAQQWEPAYEAATAYVTIPGNARLGKAAPAVPADSIIGQMQYYRALAAWQAQKLDVAAQVFDELLAKGYSDPAAYDYAYSVAYSLQDEPRKLAYSQAALDKFGTSNPAFLQRVVNCYIDQKKFDEAENMLSTAIAAEPSNGAYYLSLGVLQENQEKPEESLASFKKSVELAPENPFANYYYGRALLQNYDRLDQAAGSMSQAEYNKYAFETLRPILTEAAGYLEKAYQLDNNLTDPLRYLKNIYYVLNDGENLKRVENLLL